MLGMLVMGNKPFGELVKQLRLEKSSFDKREEQWKQMTRRVLAENTIPLNSNANQIGLSEDTIAKIEQGVTRHLTPEIIDALARGLEIPEPSKPEFYSAAGLPYSPELREWQVNKDAIQNLLRQLNYPANVRTPLWDFIAFNHYNYALYGYTQDVIDKIDTDESGPNLLRIQFDPALQASALEVGERQWEEARLRDLRAFRSSSYQYRYTSRYKKIMAHLGSIKGFSTLWQAAQHSYGAQPEFLIQPTTTIRHLDFEEMTFLSLRIPQGYVEKDLFVSVYVPLTDSLENYQKFAQSIPENLRVKVYFFRQRPLE